MKSTLEVSLAEVMQNIKPVDPACLARAHTRLDGLTKPLGSLGELEVLAERIVAIRQSESIGELKKMAYVFAADHGITAEGVSAYPKEVTRQMVLIFLSNGAAINVLARVHRVEMNVVDVGVDAQFEGIDGLLNCKVRKGTRNM